MRLSDFISPDTPAGTALFLRWKNFHVFCISKRELANSPQRVRFSGVGGKRRNCDEPFADCALREAQEEMGAVVASLESAEQSYFLAADGTLRAIALTDDGIRPRLILEKRRHSSYGSMAYSQRSYYLVAFEARLVAQPQPQREIAALLYLTDAHLGQFRGTGYPQMGELMAAGAWVDCQPDSEVPLSAELVPHGTVQFLLIQLRL
ncbi:MAG: hypothetical protein VKK04_09900 [Synechococcales bacterium]|nr:hypothetical protein [Synechococcales bacterium]